MLCYNMCKTVVFLSFLYILINERLSESNYIIRKCEKYLCVTKYNTYTSFFHSKNNTWYVQNLLPAILTSPPINANRRGSPEPH